MVLKVETIRVKDKKKNTVFSWTLPINFCFLVYTKEKSPKIGTAFIALLFFRRLKEEKNLLITVKLDIGQKHKTGFENALPNRILLKKVPLQFVFFLLLLNKKLYSCHSLSAVPFSTPLFFIFSPNFNSPHSLSFIISSQF